VTRVLYKARVVLTLSAKESITSRSVRVRPTFRETLKCIVWRKSKPLSMNAKKTVIAVPERFVNITIVSQFKSNAIAIRPVIPEKYAMTALVLLVADEILTALSIGPVIIANV
jgi:hypothetical protein